MFNVGDKVRIKAISNVTVDALLEGKVGTIIAPKDTYWDYYAEFPDVFDGKSAWFGFNRSELVRA